MVAAGLLGFVDPAAPLAGGGARKRRRAAADGRAATAAPRNHLFSAAEVSRALEGHPAFGLQAHNAAPTLKWTKWGFAVMRTAATPAGAGATIDEARTTGPFTGLKGLTELGPVLGILDVHRHVSQAIAAARAPGAAPTPVRVPVAFLGGEGDLAEEEEAEGAAATAGAGGGPPPARLRPMLFVAEGSGGGWLITEERWAG